MAAIIIGTGGSNLKKLEEELGRHIFIRGTEDIHIEKYRIVAKGSLKKIEALAFPVAAGEELSVLIEEPHTAHPAHGIARLQGYVINVEGAGEAVGRTIKVKITEVNRTFARAAII